MSRWDAGLVGLRSDPPEHRSDPDQQAFDPALSVQAKTQKLDGTLPYRRVSGCNKIVKQRLVLWRELFFKRLECENVGSAPAAKPPPEERPETLQMGEKTFAGAHSVAVMLAIEKLGFDVIKYRCAQPRHHLINPPIMRN